MIENKIFYCEEKPEDMHLGTLEDSVLFYRKQTDFRLPKKSHVLMMLDGKNFSTKVKKRFKLPFDEDFIRLMNETATYLCKHVANIKIAYTQSDEISLYLTDTDWERTSPTYDFRMCKMLSIIPAMAAAYFNKAYMRMVKSKADDVNELYDAIDSELQFEFDAKVWTVPNKAEVYKWFLHRQNDCVRNSKQQAAQTYLSHNELKGKDTDEQIRMLFEKHSIDWNAFSDSEKYGRFIYKEKVMKTTEIRGEEVEFERNVWIAHPAWLLGSLEGKMSFLEIIDKKSED